MLSWLFPNRCVLCRQVIKKEDILCLSCQRKNLFIKENPDKLLYSLFYYKDIKESIEMFKYTGIKDIGIQFAKLVYEQKLIDEIIEEKSIFVPVPLHEKRKNERGFNQAEIISNTLATLYEKESINALIRSRYTKQQIKLTKEERLDNMNEAFILDDSLLSEKGQSVILVDDIYTTGATLQACEKSLLSSRVKTIHYLTIGRTF